MKITVRLDDEKLEKLEDAAEELDESKSEIVRMSLDEYLSQEAVTEEFEEDYHKVIEKGDENEYDEADEILKKYIERGELAAANILISAYEEVKD